jgi:hypothetical protein
MVRKCLAKTSFAETDNFDAASDPVRGRKNDAALALTPYPWLIECKILKFQNFNAAPVPQ